MDKASQVWLPKMFVRVSSYGDSKLDTGGKPSTMFPPGRLVKLLAHTEFNARVVRQHLLRMLKINNPPFQFVWNISRQDVLHLIPGTNKVPLHEIDFLIQYIFHNPDIHQHQSRKHGHRQAWDGPETHWEYSQVLVKPFARKYFLHENWHFHAEYFSSHEDFVNFHPWNWGGETAWEGLTMPCEYSRMAVRTRGPYVRKYFLHENWHFRAKYFSSHQDFIIFKMWNWRAGGPGGGLDCPTSIPGRPFDLTWENIFCMKIIIFARNISHHLELRVSQTRDSDDRLPWN